MFEDLTRAIQAEQQKLQKIQQWLASFRNIMSSKPILNHPWKDECLIVPIPTTIPKITKIAGVDGGLIAEAMSGFDLILFRAVASIFQGIGEKVESTYIPNFSPNPQMFLSPSLPSRHDFNRLATLLRLYAEYDTALRAIEEQNPTILFIDGKVSPLRSDFGIAHSKIVKQAELDLKQKYRELVSVAFENQVLLCGLVKDSRSREISNALKSTIPDLIRSGALNKDEIKGWFSTLEELQDNVLGSALLSRGQRTSWLETTTPEWLPPRLGAKIWATLVRPVSEDQPVRLEIITNKNEELEKSVSIALGALYMLCNHGLPVSLPTILLEADNRAKLSQDHIDVIVDQISLAFNVPKEQLMKRRNFQNSVFTQ